MHEDLVVFLVLFLIVHHDSQQHVDDLPHLIEFLAELLDLLDQFGVVRTHLMPLVDAIIPL